jgi:hypothetical protein
MALIAVMALMAIMNGHATRRTMMARHHRRMVVRKPF